MRISAKADYAVRAAIELASAADDKPVKAERIATAQEIPLNFLENILGELRHAGIVRSHRGADGGFRLAKPADQAYSDGTWIYCSGTLISPTVFLTAAHCADVSPRVRVTFSSAYKDGDTVYAGTFHGNPAYSQSQSDPHDIAVVVLEPDPASTAG